MNPLHIAAYEGHADIVVHCASQKQAECVLAKIRKGNVRLIV